MQAAIEIKRRNDKVRHKELDHLRAVMRARWQADDMSAGAESARAVAATAQPLAQPAGAVPGGSVTGGANSKSHTMEQIARIEEQMAQSWQRRTGQEAQESPGGAATIPVRARQSPELAQSAHLGARPASAHAAQIPGQVALHERHDRAELQRALTHTGLADAALHFAQAQYALAEQGLRSVMLQEPGTLTARLAGLALLDLLLARRQFEGFEEFAAEYADGFGVPVPRWPVAADSLPQPAPSGAAASEDMPSVSSWACPLLLDAASVRSLSIAMAGAGSVKWLDWSDLLSADLGAAQALLDEVQRWLARPLELRFLGAAVLRRRLKASTPSGRRENETVWWQLRLAMLRAMHRRDEFDLVALDYCVTYGVEPAQWVAPVCSFALAEAMPPAARPAAQAELRPELLEAQRQEQEALQWPAVATTIQPGLTLFPAVDTQISSAWPATVPAPSGAAVSLHGVLTGLMPQAVTALDQACAGHAPGKLFVIDCLWLDRLDLAGAGTLWQWLMAAKARGLQIELHGVSRLVAALLHVVGMGTEVTLRLRQY